MGFIRFVFYFVVGYAILRVLKMLFAPKRPVQNARYDGRGDHEKPRDSKKMNTDGIGDYIDYEEVK
ncbi:MAG: hypothetical protein P8N19_11750 [Flavobacteriales bacterium]|nr:hypothetical protein [Flavobacteriales bacterium]